MLAVAATVGAFGSFIGSFLNVVVHRVPRGESVVRPASSCPACGSPVRAYDNVPVLAWLWLRGRCRDCGGGISVRYPLVELGTALFFAAVVLLFGDSFGRATTAGAVAAAVLQLAAFLYLAAVSVALALIDLATHRLPNVIVLPSYAVAAALLLASGALAADLDSIISAGIGMLALGGLYFGLVVAYPKGMGFGDVKLAGLLGIYLGWLGWEALLVGGFAAFLIGGVFAIVLVMARRADGKTAVPFGPWMLVGAWLGIAAGQHVAAWYLALFGIA